jgi:5-methylcytosine-specific restriction endonuclease McrA
VARIPTCYLCGQAIDPDARGDETPSIDHVTPVSRGGTWQVANLRPVHRGCNQRKGGRVICPHCFHVL